MCCWRRDYGCPCGKYCVCPSLKKIQVCRPVNELKRVPYKRCQSGALSEWDMWFKRNLNVIIELSKKLEKPISEIAELMYNFTLQNYSHIINPKGRDWTNCRVPLCRVDLCESYQNIFDLEGNLRDAMHPKSMFQLLQVMQNILTSETADSIYYQRPLSGTINSMNKAVKRLENVDISNPKDSQLDDCTDVKRSKIQNTTGITKELDTYKSVVLEPLIPLHSSDLMLLDSKGRRRGHGSRQLNRLRLEQKLILSRMLKKELSNEDSNRFLDALAETDLNNGPPIKKENVAQAAQDISTFYSTVVSDMPKNRRHLTAKGKKLSGRQDIPSQMEQTNSQPSQYMRKERMYYGSPLPVLFHEPYDHKKSSTWIRRHPDQLRMLEDGRVAASHVQRYRRDSVKKSLQLARAQWSIHSINSIIPSTEISAPFPKPALHKKPEYRRVFSFSSRRLKKIKH